jgi:hypothetical protein
MIQQGFCHTYLLELYLIIGRSLHDINNVSNHLSMAGQDINNEKRNMSEIPNHLAIGSLRDYLTMRACP